VRKASIAHHEHPGVSRVRASIWRLARKVARSAMVAGRSRRMWTVLVHTGHRHPPSTRNPGQARAAKRYGARADRGPPRRPARCDRVIGNQRHGSRLRDRTKPRSRSRVRRRCAPTRTAAWRGPVGIEHLATQLAPGKTGPVGLNGGAPGGVVDRRSRPPWTPGISNLRAAASRGRAPRRRWQGQVMHIENLHRRATELAIAGEVGRRLSR